LCIPAAELARPEFDLCPIVDALLLNRYQLPCTLLHKPASLSLRQIPSGPRRHLAEPVPLIHSELSHTHLNVEAVVVLSRHAALRKFRPSAVVAVDEFPVYTLTIVDTPHQPPLCLREPFKCDALPPLTLFGRCRRRLQPLPGADGDERADFTVGELVQVRFVEDLERRVVHSRAFIEERGLVDGDTLERGGGRTRCPSRLPDRRTVTGHRFGGGGVGAQ